MEIIKSNWGVLEQKEGLLLIIIPQSGYSYYPKSQCEIKDIEVSFDGSECTVTGAKTVTKYYDDISLEGYTKEELEDDQFDMNEIKYRDKKIWHLFKKNEIKKVPYLDGHIRLRKRVPIKITTPLWVIDDKRVLSADVDKKKEITDLSGMD